MWLTYGLLLLASLLMLGGLALLVDAGLQALRDAGGAERFRPR